MWCWVLMHPDGLGLQGQMQLIRNLKMDEYKDHILRDLLCLEDGMTAWEVEFIEDMAERASWGGLRPKQKEKLIEIYDKHC